MSTSSTRYEVCLQDGTKQAKNAQFILDAYAAITHNLTPCEVFYLTDGTPDHIVSNFLDWYDIKSLMDLSMAHTPPINFEIEALDEVDLRIQIAK